MIPATLSVEFRLACSPLQQLLSGLFHVGVLIILFLASLPLLLMIALMAVVVGLYLWQRIVLERRSVWVLRADEGRWQLSDGNTRAIPVVCDVRYLTPWLLVLKLNTGKKRYHVALFRDALSEDTWRQLHVVAKGMLRKPPCANLRVG